MQPDYFSIQTPCVCSIHMSLRLRLQLLFTSLSMKSFFSASVCVCGSSLFMMLVLFSCSKLDSFTQVHFIRGLSVPPLCLLQSLHPLPSFTSSVRVQLCPLSFAQPPPPPRRITSPLWFGSTDERHLVECKKEKNGILMLRQSSCSFPLWNGPFAKQLCILPTIST